MQTVGVFHQKSAAEHALDALRNVGMKNTRLAFNRAADTSVTERAGTGGLTGGLIGVVLGALAGLAIAYNIMPGLASINFAGPLATAIGLTGIAATTVGGALTGLVTGAIIGVIAGLALSTSSSVKTDEETEVVVTTETNDPLQAKRIMREYGADDVRTYDK